MDQETAFSPDVYVKLLDDTLIAFRRAKMNTWTKMAALIKAHRAAEISRELDADKSLKPAERAQLRAELTASIVGVPTAIDYCTRDPEWIGPFLIESAAAAGTDREVAEKALDLIPPFQQFELADVLAMLPVVSNEKKGSKENPLRPGVDRSANRSSVAPDSTGASSVDSPDASSASTPANAPTDTSSN